MTAWFSLMFTRRTFLIGAVSGFVVLGCSLPGCDVPADDQITAGGKPLLTESDYQQQQRAMVKRQLRGRDISDPLVLRAMQQVPRHEFVPKHLRAECLCRWAATDRKRSNHFATVHCGSDDSAWASQARLAGLGRRHWVGLPGRGAGGNRQACLQHRDC